MKTLHTGGCFLLLVTPTLLLYYYCVQVESVISLLPDVCRNCKHPLREPEQVPGGSWKYKGDQKNRFTQLLLEFSNLLPQQKTFLTHYVGSALNGSQRSPWRTELLDGEMWNNVKDFKAFILTKTYNSAASPCRLNRFLISLKVAENAVKASESHLFFYKGYKPTLNV